MGLVIVPRGGRPAVEAGEAVEVRPGGAVAATEAPAVFGPVRLAVTATVPDRMRTDAAATPDCPLAVVIINYCQWRNTLRLVRQLRRGITAATWTVPIIVVDNASPGSAEAAAAASVYGVTIERLPRNRGFAGGVNAGVRAACRQRSDGSPVAAAAVGPEWLLLLNPDVTVPPGFLDQLQAMLEVWSRRRPRAGIIGLGLRNRDGSPQPSCGRDPTLWGTVLGLLRPRDRRKCLPLPMGREQAVDWASGGCLLVRRECFEQLHGLDEAFFLYYEDVDFCRRARLAGWEVWYEPRLQVTHHWPLHQRAVPPPLRVMTRHALMVYAHKHWPSWQVRLLRQLIRWEGVVRYARCWWSGDQRGQECYGQLRRLICDLAHGCTVGVRRRLRCAARWLRPIAAAHDVPA